MRAGPSPEVFFFSKEHHLGVQESRIVGVLPWLVAGGKVRALADVVGTDHVQTEGVAEGPRRETTEDCIAHNQKPAAEATTASDNGNTSV